MYCDYEEGGEPHVDERPADSEPSELPSRHQRERQREDVRWQEQLPECCFTEPCFLAHESAWWQHARLTWQHHYVQTLENASALQAFPADVDLNADLAQAQSLAARKLIEDRTAAAAKVTHLEEQHHIVIRWTPDDSRYCEVAAERKCFHVHRLQNKLAAELDWLQWSQLVVKRTPHQHRGTTSDFQRGIRQTRSQLHDLVLQLRDWQAVPADIGNVSYDAQSLVVEDMQQPGFQLPWLQANAPVHQDQYCDLQQRLARCDEEADIIAREAADMHEFYMHRQDVLSSALEVRTSQSATAAADVHTFGSYSSAQEQLVRLQYVQGQKHLLTQKLHRSKQLLVRAERLLAALQQASTSGSGLPQLPVFDRRTCMLGTADLITTDDEGTAADDLTAIIGDPALTDVGDFPDISVADADEGSSIGDAMSDDATYST
ncbi:hypothetical protein ABBQ32_008755 [Trebouxia sp. C0010 RCD-2024]